MQTLANRLILVWALALTAFVLLGVAIPHQFAANTTISSSQMNENFAALKTAVDALENSPSLFGDGSAGALVAAGNTVFSGENTQFSSITIPAGVTLSVSSGTVLRSSGPVTVHGKLVVLTFVYAGSHCDDSVLDATILRPWAAAPGPGVSRRAAAHGSFGDSTDAVEGGPGGLGMGGAARVLRFPGSSAGGAGAGTAPIGFVGAGGGGLTLLSLGPVVVSATGLIAADGTIGDLSLGQVITPGTGGGAGGVIVIASAVSVTVAGQISARGAHGGGSDANVGRSGGGGGGVVTLISPNNSAPAARVLVAGGLGGWAGPATATGAFRAGGAGGGACAGDGGKGGDITTSDVVGDGAAGGDGQFFDITGVSPVGMFP